MKTEVGAEVWLHFSWSRHYIEVSTLFKALASAAPGKGPLDDLIILMIPRFGMEADKSRTCTSGYRTRVVEHAVRRYTDCAISSTSRLSQRRDIPSTHLATSTVLLFSVRLVPHERDRDSDPTDRCNLVHLHAYYIPHPTDACLSLLLLGCCS
jgi:hypothetical protein